MMVQIRLPQTINIPTHYTDHGTTLTAISSEQNISVKLNTTVSATSIFLHKNIFSSNATQNIFILKLKIFFIFSKAPLLVIS